MQVTFHFHISQWFSTECQKQHVFPCTFPLLKMSTLALTRGESTGCFIVWVHVSVYTAFQTKA